MKPIRKLLIANRGEIAIRIGRTAADLGIATVAVHSTDDADSLHTRRADEAVPLTGSGPAAYLDGAELVAVAQRTGCDAVHPGYGFLSERADFAAACIAAGLTFVGPPPAVLRRFGDKAAARALAMEAGVPVIPGTNTASTLAEVRELWDELATGSGAALVIKALAGGGGRGMRVVRSAGELDAAYAAAQHEAVAAFGRDDVYAELLVNGARHIEIQIVAGADGAVAHLGERECTLQRRHQKLVEITPGPSLPPITRRQLTDAAVTLAQAALFAGVGTFEFLVRGGDGDGTPEWWFLEANPRLQVEHTITEMVTGVDLVRAQLMVAAGAGLTELGLSPAPADGVSPQGCAVQLRINAETIEPDGTVRAATGRLSMLDLPTGPGVRVDTGVGSGSPVNPRFDSLIAKVIVHTPHGDYPEVLARARRALAELAISGVATNASLLSALLDDDAVRADTVDTDFVDRHLPRLAARAAELAATGAPAGSPAVDATADGAALPAALAEGAIAIASPMAGVVVAVEAAPGDLVRRNQPVVVIEAMKMQHPILAPEAGRVTLVVVSEGSPVREGQLVAAVEPVDADHAAATEDDDIDLELIPPGLAELRARLALGTDDARPEAVAKRAARGHRTGRTNVEDLIDDGSFIEYGALAIAGQRRRRSVDDLIQATPADGLITGIGTVNAEHLPDRPDDARCAVLAYDYSVLAGTQGIISHKKLDRMLSVIRRWRLPTVLFAEGGGGRPGDTDWMGVAMLDTPSFIQFARLSGLVPVVGIVAGRCFAGNAALLGCCDVIIATESASIGMGGPAMIEGGGLGSVAADDVGPVSVQAPNGVIDVVVADEAEAVAVAKRYVGYFQGARADWDCDDQRRLRHLIPEDRKRSYDMRAVIEALADVDSVLELRTAFGTGTITALIRIEGRPFGVIANNPRHLGGAIDAPAADKTARFLQLCDAHGLPVLSLCDTPGFMVGPESEKTATVRHVSRLFLTGGALRVPFFTVVTRKGYGLGAQAMGAGSFHTPMFTVAWPSGEFGAMGLEGAVRLGFRKELEAIDDPVERDALFTKMVELAYDGGKALNMASYVEIDAVIDPADTRRWLLRGLASTPPVEAPTDATRRFVDAW